jgi:hypothetical protein
MKNHGLHNGNYLFPSLFLNIKPPLPYITTGSALTHSNRTTSLTASQTASRSTLRWYTVRLLHAIYKAYCLCSRERGVCCSCCCVFVCWLLLLPQNWQKQKSKLLELAAVHKHSPAFCHKPLMYVQAWGSSAQQLCSLEKHMCVCVH